MVMVELDIGTIPDNLPPKDEIVGVKLQYMEVGMKRSTTCPFSILDKGLMVLVEVDICLGPALLPPIIQVILVDHLFF